jgi:hypothetical protein
MSHSKNKTPTVLRLEEDVPPVRAGCRGNNGGAWILPSDHPKTSWAVGLGGRHLTDHHKFIHTRSPPFSAHPSRVQNRSARNRPPECRPEAWSTSVLPHCRSRDARGLCLPNHTCYPTPNLLTGPVQTAKDSTVLGHDIIEKVRQRRAAIFSSLAKK